MALWARKKQRRRRQSRQVSKGASLFVRWRINAAEVAHRGRR